MLQCNSVTKRFGDFTAIDGVSMTVPDGRILGLLGPNGAGKTTLIRIINRITVPTSGQVLLDGTPMTDEMVRHLGYLPEERGLYKKMKVGEQALYLARLRGMSNAEAMASLKEWFSRLEIGSWWDKKVEELSKGMAQKVQFVTTVLHNPNLLILDEPFSGFDPVNAQVIRGEILRLKEQGKSIILSTHNMESVEELCDEIVLINKSKVVASGATDEIRRKYGTSHVEVLYRSGSSLTQCVEGAGALPFTIVSDGEAHSLRRSVIAPAEGASSSAVLGALISLVDIASYRELVPRMNDIFISLVTGK